MEYPHRVTAYQSEFVMPVGSKPTTFKVPQKPTAGNKIPQITN